MKCFIYVCCFFYKVFCMLINGIVKGERRCLIWLYEGYFPLKVIEILDWTKIGIAYASKLKPTIINLMFL